MFDMTKEKEKKIALRVDFLKQMNRYVLEHIYDESAHMGWLMVAIPDAPTEDDFLEIAWIAHAFQGIKLAVGILILDAALKMIRKMPKKRLQIGILIAAFAVILLINVLNLHLSSVVVMITAALASVAFFLAGERRRKEEQT